MSAKIQNFITHTQDEIDAFLEVYSELLEIRREWNDLGYSAAIIDAGKEEFFPDLTGTEVAAVLTGIDNLATWYGAGNGTNLQRVRK